MLAKIKDFLKQYEAEIVLVLGVILIAVIAFEAGVIKGAKISQNSVKIESSTQVAGVTQESAPRAQNLAPEGVKDAASSSSAQNCAFVGSKNSNKYHLPTCSSAKRIKPENITCFKDENEAKLKGYLPDKNCIK